MAKLRVFSGRGDDETHWEPGDKVSTELAALQFEEFTKKGYAAFAKRPGGHELIKEFDPAADEILLVGARAGG